MILAQPIKILNENISFIIKTNNLWINPLLQVYREIQIKSLKTLVNCPGTV